MSNTYKIPVTWEVYDTIEIEGETFEEAIQNALDQADEIPLGTQPYYVEGSWALDTQKENDSNAHKIAENLKELGFGEPCN